MNPRSIPAVALAVLGTSLLTILLLGRPRPAEGGVTEGGRYLLFSPDIAGGGDSLQFDRADVYKIDTLMGHVWVLRGETWRRLPDT